MGKFTGKERDSESGNDYFGARFYNSNLGRFLSPDDGTDQDPSDPQSWNLYAYGRNNPLKNIDPTGNACVVAADGSHSDDNSGGESCAAVDAANAQHQANVVVNGTPGNAAGSLALNGLMALSNMANDYFVGLTGLRAYQNDQLSNDWTGKTANIGVQVAGLVVGPEGEGAEAAAGTSKLWSEGKGLSAVKNAFQHWLKHGKEFPNLQNAKQYLEAAQEFVTNPPPGTLSKVRPNGDTVLYNPSTNTFAVRTVDGAPRTMFKPSGNGMTYFNAQ
jgi:RHS repeat-associated protein